MTEKGKNKSAETAETKKTTPTTFPVTFDEFAKSSGESRPLLAGFRASLRGDINSKKLAAEWQTGLNSYKKRRVT